MGRNRRRRVVFRRGARWTAASKPRLTEALFDGDCRLRGAEEPGRHPTAEFQPVFAAADFVRVGRDLFVQRGNVTNRMDVDRLPAILDGRDVLIAPEPAPLPERLLRTTPMCGKWLKHPRCGRRTCDRTLGVRGRRTLESCFP